MIYPEPYNPLHIGHGVDCMVQDKSDKSDRFSDINLDAGLFS